MKVTRCCLLFLLCSLISGSVALADQHAVDVSGRWVGTWTGPGASSSSAELRLQQTGSRVIGSIQLLEAPDFKTAPRAVSGVVRGTTLYLSAVEGCPLNGELEYSSERLNGRFSCVHPSNTLTVYRQD